MGYVLIIQLEYQRRIIFVEIQNLLPIRNKEFFFELLRVRLLSERDLAWPPELTPRIL